jgi:TolA-binding protein
VHATLRVAMYAGHVVVQSECLSGDRALAAGQSVTLSCVTDRPAEVSTSGEPHPPRVAEVGATATAVTVAPSPSRGVAPDASASSAPVSWQELARHGSYKQALAAAEAEGFDLLCQTLPVLELFELATAARLAGNGTRAKQAYLAVRRRFAGTDSAASAAFHLGQLAFDGASAFGEAHRWFGLYLAERPTGTLAAEALGRTMEAEQRMGDLTAARHTATVYLGRYPTGAHARLAESLQNP